MKSGNSSPRPQRLRGSVLRLLVAVASFATCSAAFSQPPAETFPQVPLSMQYQPARQPAGDMIAPEMTPPELIQVPLRPLATNNEQLQVQESDQTVSIYAREVDLRTVLASLAEESSLNIVVADDVQAVVNTTLKNVPLQQALDAILRINGLVWTRDRDIIFVTRPGEAGTNNNQGMPGRVLQVFELNYVSAAEVLEVANGLLSPAGRAFVHAVDASSVRQTRERLVVEDYPDRVQAISEYVASVDNPPQQVLIEAHVLQVTLDNDQRHGVNLDALARIAGARVNFQSQGFANAEANPGFMLGLDSGDLDGMLEALRANSYVRTLAAPKVLVVNGQEARIQIGSKFGYFVTTTTQTITLQNVDFLDIGVVLQVTPTIASDGRIMLAVQPKVSGGRINPDTGLPEEDTTEASTTVLLPDGRGMIIGGLIKETDEENKSWIPWLGKQPVIGKLFSRESRSSQRIEVIIALTPHILPYNVALEQREYLDYVEATSPEGIIGGVDAACLIAPQPRGTHNYNHAEVVYDAEQSFGDNIRSTPPVQQDRW